MKNFLHSIIVGLGLLLLVPSASAAFDDVPVDHANYEAISYLELTGALDSGKDFRPDDKITRAELFKMLFTVLDDAEPTIRGNPFEDVPNNAWFEPYATLAYQYELATGTQFAPEASVKRWFALKTLMQAYGLNPPVIPASERSPLYKDVGVKSPLYPLVAKADEEGVIESSVTVSFKPYVTLTRGEMAELLYQFELWSIEELAEAQGGTAASFYQSDIFAEIWQRVVEDFYTEPGTILSQEALFQAAVKGLLSSLGDKYTVYYGEEEANSFIDNLNGDLVGIGAILIQDDETGEIFITDFLDESPASKSGLEVGDQIIKVDDVSIEGMLMQEVIHYIRGEADTSVTLTVLRDGQTHTYTIIRVALSMRVVNGEVIYGKTWLIEIDSFGASIVEDTMRTLDELDDIVPEPKAIVLDLRGNPGGYVNMGNFVAGLFVPQLTPLVMFDYGGHTETIYNGDVGPYKNIPLYVLVDRYTASASEIVALTLREADDATIIGTPTYGKGSAQQVVTFWDGSILKLTVARWLSSAGTSIEDVGITPDVIIDPDAAESDPWLLEVKRRVD